MKPHRAFGLLAVTVLLACAASWLTPQQQYPALVPTPDALFTLPNQALR